MRGPDVEHDHRDPARPRASPRRSRPRSGADDADVGLEVAGHRGPSRVRERIATLAQHGVVADDGPTDGRVEVRANQLRDEELADLVMRAARDQQQLGRRHRTHGEPMRDDARRRRLERTRRRSRRRTAGERAARRAQRAPNPGRSRAACTSAARTGAHAASSIGARRDDLGQRTQRPELRAA
jgi:hypothetical protein